MTVREPLVGVDPATSSPGDSSLSSEYRNSKESVGLPEQKADSALRIHSSDGHSEFSAVHRLIVRLSTGLRLGITNIVRVAAYRVCKDSGIYRWLLPTRRVDSLAFPEFLAETAQPPVPWADRSVLDEADALLAGRVSYFSVHTHEVGCPPNWFLNPFRNQRHSQPAAHWSDIAAFNVDVGDIKIIWEQSRFSWATILARAWRTSGDKRYLMALQSWMQDWWRCNPPNTGPNWMCGQETSIRLINALLGLQIADLQQESVPGMADFVEAHCQRLALTAFYAVAQDNNHATSEAAGLFIGGTWLAKYGRPDAKAKGSGWARKGRRLLERAVRRLILPDGSFSQNSLTYHRLMLDTLSICEVWRRHVDEGLFSDRFYGKSDAATRWLGAMLSTSGDGPNLGPNDGAHPYRMDCSAYRDFRPCLQMASFLFTDGSALESGPWDEPAAWLGVHGGASGAPWANDFGSAAFPDGGYVVLRGRTSARVILRASTVKFRPAHADALHLDFWWKGANLLRDGGSYSYADSGVVADTLASVAGHNTPQFDDHDQMPRLSRFLYGAWIRVAGMARIGGDADAQFWTGSYTDPWRAFHKRTVTLGNSALSVHDEVKGFKHRAMLRWRLAPGNWSQNETGCISEWGQIRVEADVPIRRISLETGWESRHYLEKSPVPVLEIEIDRSPAVVKTAVTLS